MTSRELADPSGTGSTDGYQHMDIEQGAPPSNLIYATLGSNQDPKPVPPEATAVSAEEPKHTPSDHPLSRLFALLLYFTGTMHQYQKMVMATNSFPLLFLDEVLRGISQSLFMNNPLSGVIFFIGVCINSRYNALAGLTGVVASTATAHGLILDQYALHNGLFGFSGWLLGLAYSLFHFGGDGHWSNMPWEFVSIAALSALSSWVMVAAGNFTVPNFGVPPLGISFLLCSYLWIAGCSGGLITYFPVNGGILQPKTLTNPTSFPSISGADYDVGEVFKSLLVNVGNTAFQGYMYTGICFLIGVVICSRISALMVVLGSVMALLLQLAVGVPQGMVATGLLGFNCVLTAMALGGFFLVLRGVRVWFSIIVGVFLAFLLTIGFTAIFTPLSVPVLGLPFTIAVWVMIYAARGVPSIVIVPLTSLTIPENHLKLYDQLRGAALNN